LAQPACKDYGALTLFVRYHAFPKACFHIKRASFFPVPKVDSTFLSLEMREEPLLENEKEKEFFKIVRRAFCQRRKTLKNSLKGAVSPQRTEAFCGQRGLAATVRPEELSLEDFIALVNF
ncbi:MAG: rRNA adenine N-6-methyltransferase family protein, partial [Candidatus Omnitrophica bacterium]|nr:rRNA adenine N-6-methyltransferase family protein [Candidatus Omnitrophota bacterium]